MLYNLVEYLRNEFPWEMIYVNIYQKLSGQDFVPDRCAIVKETSGALSPWFQFSKNTYQVITRDADLTKARKLAYDILAVLNNKFGLLLPAVIVDGNNYLSKHTAQISAIQSPYELGTDDSGRTLYTTNYYILM